MNRGQFHHHFIRAFLPVSFCQKLHSQNVTREKQRKALLYKKFGRKMLMKLTPGFEDHVSRVRSSCEDVARIRDLLPERGSFPPIDGVRHGSGNSSILLNRGHAGQYLHVCN